MSDEFLSAADKKILENVMADYEPDGYYRFWSFSTLQLDGDFTLQDLEKFVEAMKRMRENHD